MTAVPLPPRPDPYTGEPRPPAAPLDGIAGTGEKHPERGQQQYRTQEPPPGMGPTLEGHRYSAKNSVKTGIMLACVPVIIMCILGAVEYGAPFEWVDIWWLWLIPLVGFVMPLLMMRGSTVTCGTDWVMKNGRSWAELYELKDVKLTAYAGGFHIELTDRSDRNVFFNLNTLQGLPYIWDYVYNGIVHSVASGKASANKVAIGKLQLPLPAEFTDE